MGLVKKDRESLEWPFGAIPLARDEIHEKIIKMMKQETRGKALNVPTGTGVLADRLRKMGFEVSCCDINPSFFSVPDLKIEIGDLNQSLPYSEECFDYVVCLDGIEHLENPYNAIREFRRILKKGGRIYLSTPNYLNIERRFRFLLLGTFSKIPTHEVVKEIWKDSLSMVHLSPIPYSLLKFAMEHYGFRILAVEKDRSKSRLYWLIPIVWGIRLYSRFLSKEKWEFYRLNETLKDEILMGGNTLILIAEKLA